MSRLLFRPMGLCSSLLSLLSPASLISIWASRGPCWAPTAVGSAQVLRLWSLAGRGGCCPPTPNPVLGSAQLPLAQPVVRSAGLGPLPCVAGGGLLLRAGSVPLCCLVVSGSPPSGFPTSPPPRLQWPGGRSWGVAEGQCRRRPGAGLGDAVLSCLRP